MNNILIKNWVNYLAKAMKENGCPSEIRTEEDVLNNLFYLSKEDNRGSRYIPLQYKRMIEKLVCGAFNSTLEYKDKEDVYFEKVGDTVVCNANVYWVKYLDDGTRVVLGHGFHSMTLAEVLPGVFMSDAERASKWKSTTIGGAKSRALYDGGIGLEFYGDIFMPEINLDEQEIAVKEEVKAPSEKKSAKPDVVYSETGMPIPQPKRGRPKKVEEAEVKPSSEITDVSEPVVNETVTEVEKPVKTSNAEEMSVGFAKSLKADVGNYAGMPLGEIYEIAPKNLVFLARNSVNKDVAHAATIIIRSDKELSERFVI